MDRKVGGKVTMKEELRVMWPKAKEFWQPPEGGRDKEQTLPLTLGREYCLLHPEFGLVDPRTNFCCFTATRAWQFVSDHPKLPQ
jgi:hypothetical protein